MGERLFLVVLASSVNLISAPFAHATLDFPKLPNGEPLIQVINESSPAVETGELLLRASEAANTFQKTFGPLPRRVLLKVTSRACVSVGYVFDQDVIIFCGTRFIVNYGMNAPTVIHHEMFHAMTCQLAPSICTPQAIKDPEILSLHEGLADFFAYQLSPGVNFGEGFYTDPDRPFLRKYRSEMCYSLIEGPHARGTTLVTHLIDQKYGLDEIAAFLKKSDFKIKGLFSKEPVLPRCFNASSAPAITFKSENYPFSNTRYLLKQDIPLILNFSANDAFIEEYSDLSLNITLESGEQSELFDIKLGAGASGHSSAVFTALPEANGTEKLRVQFQAHSGRSVGLKVIYVGVRTPALSAHSQPSRSCSVRVRACLSETESLSVGILRSSQ